MCSRVFEIVGFDSLEFVYCFMCVVMKCNVGLCCFSNVCLCRFQLIHELCFLVCL